MEENTGSQEGTAQEAAGGGGEGEGNAPDPIQQLKGEFNRKIGNVSDQLKSTTEALRAITEQMQAAQRPQAPASDEVDLEDLSYRDPKKYAKVVAQQATQEATQVVTARIAQQQATQSEIMRIQSEYPEFAHDGSEAAALALKKFQEISPSLRGTPEGARLVMLDVVHEMGLTPKSKRKQGGTQDDDSFTMGASSGGASQRRDSRGKVKVDNATLAFAEQMGMDVSDPKVLERLAKQSEQRNGKWNKYR